MATPVPAPIPEADDGMVDIHILFKSGTILKSGLPKADAMETIALFQNHPDSVLCSFRRDTGLPMTFRWSSVDAIY